ncbi:hypothetical protein THAOC_33585 [Thalassiosira oceanica]|uniref:Uncharacterized protein n=1 Tax=Thalassiosira oceanica TaxID=159749 RepID=K0RLX3_THAOC|nr:hypothetical protein THAOC_33585 [Thalassiosira oceanica]|eukprot:EJK47682.1 hypothetical protein THAOC_33585 [Thalassiosira oceanica]
MVPTADRSGAPIVAGGTASPSNASHDYPPSPAASHSEHNHPLRPTPSRCSQQPCCPPAQHALQLSRLLFERLDATDHGSTISRRVLSNALARDARLQAYLPPHRTIPPVIRPSPAS